MIQWNSYSAKISEESILAYIPNSFYEAALLPHIIWEYLGVFQRNSLISNHKKSRALTMGGNMREIKKIGPEFWRRKLLEY